MTLRGLRRMRAAPAVTAALSACRFERGGVIALYALTGVVLAGWCLQWAAAVAPMATLAAGPQQFLVMLAAASLAAWLGRRMAHLILPGTASSLNWNGQGWSLAYASTPHGAARCNLSAMVVPVDLGSWLVIRAADEAGGRHWLVASRRHAPADWHLLRVALMAHASQPGEAASSRASLAQRGLAAGSEPPAGRPVQRR